MASGRRSRRARLNGAVSRLTTGLDRRKTPLGLAVLAVGAFLAYVAFASTTGPPFQSGYEIKVSVPPDAPILREGQAIRVGGRLAGLISAVEPDREADATTVTANITKPDFRPLPDDTEAYVRVHSIVYETYLELRPGKSREELETGDALQAPATSGVDLLEVVQLFDNRTREALGETLVNGGFGVAGRGAQLNEAFADLPALARNASAQLRAATREQGALGDLIVGAAGTASGLRGERSDDVSALIDASDATFGTIARRRDELGATIERLRPFEDQLLTTAPDAEPLLDDAAALADDLEPTVRAVNSQLPDLNRLFASGDTLRSETRRITAVADPVLRASRPVVFGLFPTLTALRPLNRDLEKLKATVDPYKPEVSQSGRRLADAASVPFPQGLASGAPALRVLPVLTPHPCQNPIPDPGEAQQDSC